MSGPNCDDSTWPEPTAAPPSRRLNNLTIVLPAFNEEEAIGGLIDRLQARFPDTALLVVDDGSTDRTADIVRGRQVRLVRHTENRGYGAAWKSGVEAADTGYIAFFDSDGQFDPDDLERLYDRFLLSSADMVSGCRKQGSYVDPIRAPGKLLVAAVARLLVGRKIPDLNCGLRIFDRKLLMRYLRLLPNGFSASATSMILFQNRGYRVEFIDIITSKRLGKSSVSIVKDGFNTLLLIMRLVALFNPMRIFNLVAASLLTLGSVYSVAEIVMRGLGMPVFGAVVLIASTMIFLIGLVCDQIATLRLEVYDAGAPLQQARRPGQVIIEEPDRASSQAA